MLAPDPCIRPEVPYNLDKQLRWGPCPIFGSWLIMDMNVHKSFTNHCFRPLSTKTSCIINQLEESGYPVKDKTSWIIIHAGKEMHCSAMSLYVCKVTPINILFLSSKSIKIYGDCTSNFESFSIKCIGKSNKTDVEDKWLKITSCLQVEIIKRI